MNIRLNIQPIGETINVPPEHVVLHETYSPFLGHVAELLRDVEDDGTFTTSVRVIRKSPGGGAYEITYTEA